MGLIDNGVDLLRKILLTIVSAEEHPDDHGGVLWKWFLVVGVEKFLIFQG